MLTETQIASLLRNALHLRRQVEVVPLTDAVRCKTESKLGLVADSTWAVYLGPDKEGNHIVALRAEERSTIQTFYLLAHELVHARQFERMGCSWSHFLRVYLAAGQDGYRENELEVEAVEVARSITRKLANIVDRRGIA